MPFNSAAKLLPYNHQRAKQRFRAAIRSLVFLVQALAGGRISPLQELPSRAVPHSGLLWVILCMVALLPLFCIQK
jgi:hypothetical protein